MRKKDVESALNRLNTDAYKNYRIRYDYCPVSRLFTAYTKEPIFDVLTGAGRTERQVRESMHAAIDQYEAEWGSLAIV